MKKQILLIALTLMISGITEAQSPQAIRYQGVARDGSGNPISNQSLIVRLGVRDGSVSGPVVYLETHNVTTNQFGLYNVSIGQGNVQTGTFSSVNWGSGSKFIEQEVDFGSGFQNMGISQFLSVPYALHAANGSVAGPQGPAGPAGPQGPTGPQGPQGPAGGGWTLMSPSFNAAGQVVVNGTAGSGGPVTSSQSAWLEGGNNLSAGGVIGTISNQDIDVITNSTARGRIMNNGQFVWGTTTPVINNSAGNFIANTNLPFALTAYAPVGTTGPLAGITAAGNSANQASIFGNYLGSGSGSGVHGTYNGTNNGLAISGVQGVYSSSTSSSGGVGVIGFNSADFSGNYNRTGVLGLYSSNNAYGIGVLGIGFGGSFPSATTSDYGVVGWVGNNTDYSGYFNGNFVVSNGSKNASVPTSKGNQLLYVTESPEVWFEDLGGAQLVNGEATVNLDPLFLETVVIDQAHPMRVFVQMEGESEQVYVVKNGTSFTVKERNGGKSNAEFSYRIMAKRLHFQDHRFGSDPVWGAGDTRMYSKYSTPPAIDYYQNLEVQKQKRASSKDDIVPPGFLKGADISKALKASQSGAE